MWGHSPAGIFGYSHMLGGYAGGQAQYARVPYADVGPIKIADGLTDEQVLFLSDIFPTGYMAAEACDIRPGDVVAVWGCGPVGQFCIKSAFMLGAERVIAIDRFPERLRMARDHGGAETIDYEELDVFDALMAMTGGRGPDACIDAVGMEAHGTGVGHAYDRVKQKLKMHSDRGEALREALTACRKGGRVAVLGVYGVMDKFPIGTVINKGLTLRGAQQHGHRYVKKLLEHARKGDLDSSYLVTHKVPLEQGPAAYEMFEKKTDGCVRAVLVP
jgi:threonine dehydrogenase-like Zn-dependent dehydrogenase